ncbi:trypsin-like peptidase domain-containing protein [Vampirovibrio sp.]|uniref:trypsin-like peptidase domain-containing protein n=1 Tax=Vampirovibrio sp. TaxID=2717857 RepID=UPI003593909A
MFSVKIRSLSRFRQVVSFGLMLTLAFSGALASTALQPAMARSLSIMPQTFSPALIADVAEIVAPSVVNIDVEKTTRAASPNLSGLPFSDDLLRRFFGFESGGGSFSPFGGGGQLQTVTGNGSGMILSKDGYILTNNHVVSTADKVTVTLNDGRQFPAQLVGRDALSDVAVLKIEAPNLTPVTLGNSEKLRPGEWVIAVGSPLGFDHTVTLGIISALSRRIPDLNSNLSFIQTDAAINPGNSGGPLVNLKGEVIGINTAISGRGQNIGFAIPVDTVKTIADTLIAGKQIVRPWVGISMVDLNPELAKHVGLPPATQGVVIAQVMQNSPAYKAGLMQGDVIQKIDGKLAIKADVVQESIRQKPVNAKINLDILRNGHLIPVAVLSEQLPASDEGVIPIRPRVQPLKPAPF